MERSIERRHAPVPAELVEYLKTAQSAPVTGSDGVHLHVHHHYPPAPAPAQAPEVPRPTVAEKVVPWLMVSLLACVVAAICAAVLAVAGAIIGVTLAGLSLFGLVALFVLRQYGETAQAQARAEEVKAKAAAKVGRRR